jgi:hypothetical protein
MSVISAGVSACQLERCGRQDDFLSQVVELLLLTTYRNILRLGAPFGEVDSRSADEEICRYCENQMFVTMFA